MELTINRPNPTLLYLKEDLKKILGDGKEAKVVPNAGAFLVYPPGLKNEHVLKSAELIVEDLKHRITLDKDKEGPIYKANKIIEEIEDKICVPLSDEQRMKIVDKCVNDHFGLRDVTKQIETSPLQLEEHGIKR